MTPNVFIISSGHPGHPIAAAIARVLSESGEVDVNTWKSGSDFMVGENLVDTLQRTTLIYDFGLAVLTPDDLVEKRGTASFQSRDNVLFELGLFMGARGRSRALPLLVSLGGAIPSVPSDLMGIKLDILELPFERDEVPDEDELMDCAPLKRFALALRERLLRAYQRSALTILPSAGLAIGYFYNFIKPTLEGLTSHPEIAVFRGKETEVVKVDLTRFKLQVLIPTDINLATRERWAQIADSRGLDQGYVNIPRDSKLPRSYPFRLEVSRGDGADIVLAQDLPTTLFVTQNVVDEFIGQSEHATDEQRAYAMESEIHNFIVGLKRLLEKRDHYAIRDLVEFKNL